MEGLRVRVGGRTYKSTNDLFRLEAYTAYGFKDKTLKYGFQAKWLVNKKNRFIITGGKKNDIEQIGATLTANTDVLGRSDGSSSLIGTGTNDKLTRVNISTITGEIEPTPNLILKLSANYKTLSSASDSFSLDYNDTAATTGISSKIRQLETVFSAGYYPKRKMSGFGVQREAANTNYTQYFTQITRMPVSMSYENLTSRINHIFYLYGFNINDLNNFLENYKSSWELNEDNFTLDTNNIALLNKVLFYTKFQNKYDPDIPRKIILNNYEKFLNNEEIITNKFDICVITKLDKKFIKSKSYMDILLERKVPVFENDFLKMERLIKMNARNRDGQISRIEILNRQSLQW